MQGGMQSNRKAPLVGIELINQGEVHIIAFFVLLFIVAVFLNIARRRNFVPRQISYVSQNLTPC